MLKSLQTRIPAISHTLNSSYKRESFFPVPFLNFAFSRAENKRRAIRLQRGLFYG